MARILPAQCSAARIENPRGYAEYSLRFSTGLTRILTAQPAHRSYAVFP